MSELVVVGVDGSPDSHAALRWAAEHVVRLGSQLLVAHVWTPIPRFAELPPRSRARLERDRARTVQDAQRRVKEALAELDTSASCVVDTLVLDGSPGSHLVRLSARADQVVLGATGLGTPMGMSRPPIGSTVRYVLRHAYCPVTVISGARLAERDDVARSATTADSEDYATSWPGPMTTA
jgi:nucleotide-binding universal stress UspA family protein